MLAVSCAAQQLNAASEVGLIDKAAWTSSNGTWFNELDWESYIK